jgi:hypothetical protein
MGVNPLREPIAATAGVHGNLIVTEERGSQLRVCRSEDGQLSYRMNSTVSIVRTGRSFAKAESSCASNKLRVGGNLIYHIPTPGKAKRFCVKYWTPVGR